MAGKFDDYLKRKKAEQQSNTPPVAGGKFASYLAGKKPQQPAPVAETPPTADPTSAEHDKEAGHIWGLDTGVRIHPDQIRQIADKYKTDPNLLLAQAARYGATYPGATPGEKAISALYHAGDTALLNIPSWWAKKFHDDGTERAIDELKEQIQSGKTGVQKGADILTGIASPARLPASVAQKAAQASKFGEGILTGTAMGGAAALGNSKQGEELESTLAGAEAGGILAPGFQKGAELLARGGAKILGKGHDVVDPYLNDEVVRSRVNNDDLTFENVQEQYLDAPRRAHIAEQDKAAQAVADAKEAAGIARDEAGRVKDAFRQSLADTEVPGDVPELIDAGLQKTRQQIGSLATKQTEMLEPDQTKYSLEHVLAGLRKARERELVAGTATPNDPEIGGIDDTIRLFESLRPTPKESSTTKLDPLTGQFNQTVNEAGQAPLELRPADIAKLRQKNDALLAPMYDQKTGSYVQRSDRASKQARAELNKILKTQMPNSEEYSDLVGQLADESQFAENASDAFGGDRKLGLLSTVFEPNNRDRLQLLQQLDTKHNLGIMKRLKEYRQARELLGNKILMEQAQSQLPEVAAAKQADEAVGTTKNAAQALADKHAPYAGITPDSSQSALRKMLFANPRKPEVRTREALEALANETGQDVLGNVGALRVKEALGGGGPQGSRLVNLGRSVGKAVGGNTGEAVGGFLGAATDYSTGKVAKSGLDAFLKSKDALPRAAAQAVVPAKERLESRSEADSAVVAKYEAMLDGAEKRNGPAGREAVHRLLLKKDPTYRKLFGE